ncbi:hypothetical protein ABT116_42715 [Streptomyces sp. NPDC002130]|uniref:hypothetical protein n=2 Tax=Actinomycetota TaxID=201174 RepID=UPI003323EC17
MPTVQWVRCCCPANQPKKETGETMQSPRRDPFLQYWTSSAEGLAKWASTPDGAWTRLVAHLRKHMSERHAKGLASKYYRVVFGMWVGERKGKNPLGPG